MAEYWNAAAARWQMVDAQLDATWQQMINFEGDPFAIVEKIGKMTRVLSERRIFATGYRLASSSSRVIGLVLPPSAPCSPFARRITT